MSAIIKATTVLKLSDDKGKLFGWSWNKKEESATEHAEMTEVVKDEAKMTEVVKDEVE
jgi:hypothetical protein